MADQQPGEAFRGGTETLQRLAEMESMVDLLRELTIYNLVFTVLTLIICIVKIIIASRSSHRIANLETKINEYNTRAQGMGTIAHELKTNQDYFRTGLDKALDFLNRLVHTIEPRERKGSGDRNRASNEVNINTNGMDKHTPADFQNVLLGHIKETKAQLGYQLDFERRRNATLEKRLEEFEKRLNNDPATPTD